MRKLIIYPDPGLALVSLIMLMHDMTWMGSLWKGQHDISQGHVNEYEEALELQFNREDYSTDEVDDGKEDLKDSRKRLRKSEKGSKVGSQAKKRKIVLSRQSSFLTSVKIQDQVKSPKDDDEVSISTKKSNQSKQLQNLSRVFEWGTIVIAKGASSVDMAEHL